MNAMLERRRRAAEQFHTHFYNRANTTWKNMSWMGIPVQKCPMDLWIYQELLYAVRPDAIIETGTLYGGSALFMAHVCDLLQHGRVITIDNTEHGARPSHPRILYIVGDSASDGTAAIVQQVLHDMHAATVMVILDSDHKMHHVLRELTLYAPFVTPGSYLIVEDTNLNGHPVWPSYGPGPMEAVQSFVSRHPEFVVDTQCEKFMLTFNPNGYLRRVTG